MYEPANGRTDESCVDYTTQESLAFPQQLRNYESIKNETSIFILKTAILWCYSFFRFQTNIVMSLRHNISF